MSTLTLNEGCLSETQGSSSWACASARRLGTIGRLTVGLIADIDSGVDIGRSLMLTHDTTEHRLRTAVCLFAVAADRTRAAGVARIYRHNRDACSLRLVADELPQLSKGPIAVSCPLLWPSSPRPLANMRQLFQRDRPLRAFSLCNEPLSDAVVRVLLKPSLPTRKTAQPLFGRPCTDRLECRSTMGVPFPFAIDLRTRMDIAVAIGREIDATQVYPDHSLYLLRIRIRHVAHRQQIEHPFVVDQIAFASAVRQQRALMLAQTVGDVLPPCNRPDRHRAFVGVPGQVAVIKGDSPCGRNMRCTF